MITELKELKVLRNDVDLKNVLRLQFVQSYYGDR